MAVTEISHTEWVAKGRALFGDDRNEWRFVCPACGHVARFGDWVEADAETMAAFSCVGRLAATCRDAFEDGPGPCNYAGGGLFRINPVRVLFPDGGVLEVFAFAPAKGEEDEERDQADAMRCERENDRPRRSR